jgi:hypothetical protein
MAAEPVKLANGTLRVPVGGVDPKTGTYGDGAEIIQPTDPRYQEWLPFVRKREPA